MAKDFYEILGVARGASADEIKRAYRQLAKKYHPDVTHGDKGAEEKFKEISAAYDILGDPEKRKKYDQFGQWTGEGGFDPRHQAYRTWNWTSGGGGGGEGPSFDFDLGDIFGDLFGMRSRGSRSKRGRGAWEDSGASATGAGPPRGQDIHSSLKIGFEEAARGGTRRIVISREGRSREGREEKIDVKIPAGIKDGGKIRLAGKGEGGGDLYLEIHVEPHPIFRREGDDLSIEVPITFLEAVFGTSVKVPTLEGSVSVKIPPGTSSGQKLRLGGKGVPHLGEKGRGDQYVVVKIVVPPNLDDTSREMLRQIMERIHYNPREK